MDKFETFELLGKPVPASAQDITMLENRVGCKIPDSYKAFLRKYNQAEWHPLVYRNAANEEQEITSFFSINDPIKSCDILENYVTDTESGNNIDNHLPIGCSSFGDLISISLNESDYGAVWLRDDQLSFGDRGNMSAYSKVSNSFEDFANMLTEDQN